ncbi:MAG: FtsX-like permease family protein [Actinobacteria bacterium]|nr:MAG: FtsX-like permease family protein [Actinomycetota bacterium]
MGVAVALAREGFRRRRAALAVIALVLAGGVGAALTSLEVAERTRHAYPDYLHRAAVGELVVNPSLVTEKTEALIRSVPGVVRVRSDSLLNASAGKGTSDFGQVRASHDGRYVDQDRPAVDSGRMIKSGQEAFVSRGAAAALGVTVGDTLPVSFYEESFAGPDAPTAPRPIGAVRVRVVGIGVFQDEVLPDELFPREKLLVTSEVARPFDCTRHQPDSGDLRSLEELAPTLVPPGCALSYRYFSLRVRGGDAGAVRFADALAARFRQENVRLPRAMQDNHIGYEVIPSFRSDDSARVQKSLSPVVTALRAFGAVAGMATIAVALLLIGRLLRLRGDDVRVWRGLGISPTRRTLGLALPPTGAVVAGLFGSVAVAWLASPLGPVASARAVVPAGTRHLSIATVLTVAAATVLLGIGVTVAAHRVVRSSAATAGRTPAPRRSFPGAGRSPGLALGIRAATVGGGANALLAGVGIAVAAATATLVFSASLVRFLDTPARFGWPFDIGALVNAGYGQTNLAAVAKTLDRPDVERWGLAAMSGGLAINGETVPFVAGRRGFDAFTRALIISGRAPRRDHEIALGSITARHLHLHVGDEATVATSRGKRKARVTGLVVLPSIGPFESDRASLGTGALISSPLFAAVVGGVDVADNLAGFVAVDLAAGADPASFLAKVRHDLPGWDPFHVPPPSYAEPVRPATVVDVAASRRVPALLAGLLGLTMAVSVVTGIASGTRARRRELAVLRAVGAVPRQLRASVRWHALVVVLIGLVVGLPIGIAAGRAGFTVFARDIGAATRPAVPPALLSLIVLGAVVLALVAAAVPARRSSRWAVAGMLSWDERAHASMRGAGSGPA